MKTLAIRYYFSDFDPEHFWARNSSQPLWRRAVDTVGVWNDRQRRHLLELLAARLAIAWHSDGKTYGALPGKFSPHSHVQLYVGLPKRSGI